MKLQDRLREKLHTRAEKQLDLDIAKLEEELSGGGTRRLGFGAFLRWLEEHVAVLTALVGIATVALGLLTYKRDVQEKRETRLYSLVDILQRNSSQTETASSDIATAAIGSIRSGFLAEKRYAFLIAFSTMQFAVRSEKASDPVRRIASQTLADAIYRIEDYPEFQAIFAKWYEVVATDIPNPSPAYVEDTQRVVCALGHTIKRFNLPGSVDMSACRDRDR